MQKYLAFVLCQLDAFTYRHLIKNVHNCNPTVIYDKLCAAISNRILAKKRGRRNEVKLENVKTVNDFWLLNMMFTERRIFNF